MEQVETQILDDIIDRAITEDLNGDGDITSKSIFGSDERAQAVIRSKSSGVVSGMYILEPLFKKIGNNTHTEIYCTDGDVLEPGQRICQIEGPINSILAVERIALNFLQRLSGIATLTSQYVSAIAHTNAHLLDTRKTTPTLRHLEKMAVLHGGGINHRFGLYDMILIKDTHVKRAGGVEKAMRKASVYKEKHTDIKIEIEVQHVAEFIEALEFSPDRIMLDNMNPADIKLCVKRRKGQYGKIELEASGNVTLQTISLIAETGVDFISVGSITHSAPSLDIHLIIL